MSLSCLNIYRKLFYPELFQGKTRSKDYPNNIDQLLTARGLTIGLLGLDKDTKHGQGFLRTVILNDLQ
jgi:hypothetical protein